MHVFLLVLGAVISVAGIALVASGVSLQDHALDPATVTPGAVAVIGGLIIIGLGLAVRTLQRIEQTLATRPMPAGPGTIAAATAERSPEPPAAALPQNIAKTQSQQQAPPMPTVAVLTAAASAPTPLVPPAPPVATAPAASTKLADPTLEQFREKFPALVRLENPVAESEVSQTLQAPVQLDEQQGKITNGHATSAANDSKPVMATPRAQAEVRSITPERRKASVFEALWPTGPRVGRQTQAAVAQNPVPAVAEPEPQVAPEPVVELAHPQQASAAVSILKSGVVDGMAYTLYSDGSIEAQLPQGTLRFGSITELRNHIEQST
jgi:hypothetical protein